MEEQKLNSSNEALKELLLADHAHFSNMFANNEQSGETRVNWFIGIVTATTGGLLALIVKQLETQQTLLDPALLFAIVFGGVCGLLAFGIITLMRMMLRNSSTDRQKRALDEVRQMFQDYFDPQHLLLRYHPLGVAKKADPKKEKPVQDGQRQQSHERSVPTTRSEKEDAKIVWGEFKRELSKQRKGGRLRKLGGLAHTVAAINSVLVAVFFGMIVYAILRVEGRPALPTPNWLPLIMWGIAISLVCLIAFGLQRLWITYSEIKARLDNHAGDCTHAGGVVYHLDGGKVKYVIVRPKDPQKNEWVLPKGKIKDYESHQETALREVREEAGIGARIICLLDQVEFKANDKLVRSKFYLMEKSGREELTGREPTWKEFTAACESLTHPEGKSILELAEARIKSER
jgi:8-oxo-dGTP pyrophosphatase MutT (NUDIX family)